MAMTRVRFFDPICIGTPSAMTMPPNGHRRQLQRAMLAVPLAWLACLPAMGYAHTDKPHGGRDPNAPREQKPWGIAGDPARVRRTAVLRMNDRMRFTPAHLDVALGETVRLRVHNDGKVMHELVLGTDQELREHAELMKKFPGMEHDEPWMAHVSPGRSSDIVWQFNRAGDFHFACLIAGHYEAGMRGTLRVRAS